MLRGGLQYQSVSSVPPDDRSFSAFKRYIEQVEQEKRVKQAASEAKKHADSLTNHRKCYQQVYRAQRYLGLRHQHQRGLGLEDFAQLSLANQDVNPQVVFVAVDVESFEHAHHKITEVGISMLDTLDLQEIAVGGRRNEWMTKIHSRHLRIREYAHLVNKRYVKGCPEKFHFGKSELVSIEHVASLLEECFRPPTLWTSTADVQRKIVLVGHDVEGDIKYLQMLGFNVLTLDNLHDQLDTSFMFRALKREMRQPALGSILVELGLTGWDLHNAGNDATYTLQ